MAAPPQIPRLIGREGEVRCLGETLDLVAAGRSAIVLIEGEAGIGKTRLLQGALSSARRRGIQVLAGGARELERRRPFGLVADALGCVRSSSDPRRAAIARLLATHGDERAPITVTSDPGLQFRAVDACTNLLEELALAGPIVLAVDDLQWADPLSLVTLGAAVRQLSDLPVALIGCFRPSPRPARFDELAAALHRAGGQQITLGPLSDSSVRQLAQETIAAEPGPELMMELSGAAGNPLFVTELIGALDQVGAIRSAAGRAEVTHATLPPTLRLTILHRLSFLPESALEILRTASLLGSPFSLRDLAVVTGRPILELSELLTPAIQARVVADDGSDLRFRHDLIRDAVYEDLPISVREALHREIGHRLARSDAPPMQVAEHLTRGGGQDDETIEWLTRAAREAAVTSFDVAADLLERATSLMRPTNPERDRLLVARAAHLMSAGRVAEALAAGSEVLDRQHAADVDGQARLTRAHALLASGRPAEALAELDLAGGSTRQPEAAQATALAWAGFARLSLADLDGAAARAGEARAVATGSDAPYALSIAAVTLAAVSESQGHVAVALDIIDEAIGHADNSAARAGHRYPMHITRGHILIESDRHEEARSALRTGLRLSEDLGVRWPLASYAAYRALGGFISGQWDDAVAEIEASLEMAEDTGETYSSAQAHTLLSLVSLHRNELTRAAESADAAIGILGERGGRFRAAWTCWAHALVLEARGEVGAAFTTLAESWDRCAESGQVLEYRTVGPTLVRLALMSGEAARARQVATAAAGLAHSNPTNSSMAAAALRCRGLATDDAPTLLAAVDAYSSGSRPLELALTCEDAGTAFARRADLERAGPLFDRAIGIYGRLGALRDRSRAEAAARAAGISRARRGPRGRPPSGWTSLTPTERTIAALVADGLSNPQIGDQLYISRRTVQAHLAHIFPKLHIGSRAQLAAEATRQRARRRTRPLSGE